jgi:hypothetical protein
MMNKLSKKFISVLVALAMLLALSAAAFAAEGIQEAGEILPDTVFGFVIEGNDSYSQKEYTIETEFEGVRESSDGFYAMEVDTIIGAEKLPVGRLDVDLADANAVQALMENVNVSEAVKTAVQEKRALVLANDIDSLIVTLFSQNLLSVNSLPNADDSLLRSSSAQSYYTYNGSQMMTEKLYSYGLSTGWEYIQSGNNTRTVAATVYNITLAVVSVATKTLGFLAAGISIFQAFVNQFGSSWATGHTSDYAQARLIYDDVSQWTYLNWAAVGK